MIHIYIMLTEQLPEAFRIIRYMFFFINMLNVLFGYDPSYNSENIIVQTRFVPLQL